MILVVDVGNTNITFGVYDRRDLVTTFRLMAKTQRTSDEYGVLITELLAKNHVHTREIEGAIIASVAHGRHQTLCDRTAHDRGRGDPNGDPDRDRKSKRNRPGPHRGRGCCI